MPTTTRGYLFSTVLVSALSLHSSIVAASPRPSSPVDETASRTEAIRKYDAGSKAFANKQYKDAIDLFLEADGLVSSPALAFNTALAYEAMGDSSSALRWSREYLRRAPEADDRSEVQKKIATLEQELRRKGVQQVTILSSPHGATVLVDDKPVGVTPFTCDLIPGTHRVELRLSAYRTTHRTFALEPGRALNLELELDLARDDEDQRPTEPATRQKPIAPRGMTPESSEGAGPLSIAGLTFFAAGAASFGVAVGLEVARASREADAREAEAQMEAVHHIEAMEDFQLGARVAIGVGSGLVLAGGTMLVVGLVTERPIDDRTPQLSAACASEGCFFAMRTRL